MSKMDHKDDILTSMTTNHGICIHTMGSKGDNITDDTSTAIVNSAN